MVLADTNIIIDLWKKQDQAIMQIFENEKICICGVIRSELMHGAVSDKNLKEISTKLDYLYSVNIKDNQWDDFGRFLYKLRTSGVTLPYSDAMIAFIAIKNNLELLICTHNSGHIFMN